MNGRWLSLTSARRWLAVLACGASAALAVWLYLQQTHVPVPVAARDIPPHKQIQAGDITWRRLPREALLPSTLQRPPEGAWSTRLQLRGEPFDGRGLSQAPPGRLFGTRPLEPGSVAMAVPLGPVNGLGGSLGAGDEVMIVATEESAGRATLLVPRASVLEVRAARTGGLSAEEGVAILQLRPEEAVRLSAALSLRGTVYLAVIGSGAQLAGEIRVQLFEGEEP